MCVIFVLFYLIFITVCKLAEAVMRKVQLENLQNGDCRYKSEDAPLQTSARPSRKDKFAQANIQGPCLPRRRGRVMSSTSRPNNGRETEQAAIRIRCPPTAPAFPARNVANHPFRCPPTAPAFPARNVADCQIRCPPTTPAFQARNVADCRIRCPPMAPAFPARNVANHPFRCPPTAPAFPARNVADSQIRCPPTTPGFSGKERGRPSYQVSTDGAGFLGTEPTSSKIEVQFAL
eukprot:XP_016660274.1 PREDICTED: uncharacterized protein LOC107883879 [Acyrthosiphon pisum]